MFAIDLRRTTTARRAVLLTHSLTRASCSLDKPTQNETHCSSALRRLTLSRQFFWPLLELDFDIISDHWRRVVGPNTALASSSTARRSSWLSASLLVCESNVSARLLLWLTPRDRSARWADLPEANCAESSLP